MNSKVKINNVISKIRRRKIIKEYRKRLLNKDFTIISSNCNGGFIMHDLGVRFNSPTVNLMFKPSEFIKFIKYFDEYIEYELIEFNDSKYNFPIGKLNDIKIYFQHYRTFNEAKISWEKRKKRINKKNLFIIATDRDGCTEKNIMEFDELPYKNKVIFTHKPYYNIKSTYYIRGFENNGEVGVLSCFDGSTGKRYLDQFDYISWLNKGYRYNE